MCKNVAPVRRPGARRKVRVRKGRARAQSLHHTNPGRDGRRERGRKCRQDKAGVDGRNQTSCISCEQLARRDSAQPARHSAKSPSPHPPRPAPQHALHHGNAPRAPLPSLASSLHLPLRSSSWVPTRRDPLLIPLAQHTTNPLARPQWSGFRCTAQSWCKASSDVAAQTPPLIIATPSVTVHVLQHHPPEIRVLSPPELYLTWPGQTWTSMH